MNKYSLMIKRIIIDMHRNYVGGQRWWSGVAVKNGVPFRGEVESTVKVHGVKFLENLGVLPVFFSSRSHVLSCGHELPPSLCCGWWCEHALQYHSSCRPFLQLGCARPLLSSWFSLSCQCTVRRN